MYNLRYHIASLVAVFLALALGLVLGGTVVQRGTMDEQREAIVAGLQDDFERLSSENEALAAELGALSRFSESAAVLAAQGRLDGDTVVVLANTGRAVGLQNVRRAVESAGGEVRVITLERPKLGVDDPDARESMSAAGLTEIDLESLATSMAAEWRSTSATRTVTEALEDAGILSMADVPPGTPVDGIVTLAAFDEGADAGAIELAKRLSGVSSDQGAVQSAVPAVGAETLLEATGVARAAASAGLGSVDDVGIAPGQWSMVWMLSSGELGYYGQAEDADAPFAPLVCPPPSAS